MKNLLAFSYLFLFITIVSGQTSNQSLNSQLREMRKFFLAEDYHAFADYTYPKVIEMMGGKERMIQATESSMNQMKSEGYQIKDIDYKDASGFLSQGKELQCSLTQELLMKIPQGEILSEYTLIAISEDDGKSWKFLDTSGKSKETMLKYFPNLPPDIDIKQKKQKMLE